MQPPPPPPLPPQWSFFLEDKTSAPDISVAVRSSLAQILDKFSDGQLLWLRDMTS